MRTDLPLDAQDLKAFQPFVNCRSRMEQEKRLRREIANSNERRRMQSINVGFQSLKSLLPKRDGEKISKASILQQSVHYIRRLQSEKAQLLTQIYQYKQIVELTGGKIPPLTPLSEGLLTMPSPETQSPMDTSIGTPDSAVGSTPPYQPHKGGTEVTNDSPQKEGISPISPSPPQNCGSISSTDSGAGSINSEGGASPEPRPSPDPHRIQAPPKKRKFLEFPETEQPQQPPTPSTTADPPAEFEPPGPKRPTPVYGPQIPRPPPPPPSGLIRPTPIVGGVPQGGPRNVPPGVPQGVPGGVPQGGPKPKDLELLKKELIDMRLALDCERRSRVALEDHVIRNMELARLQTQMAIQSPVPAVDCSKSLNSGLLAFPAQKDPRPVAPQERRFTYPPPQSGTGVPPGIPPGIPHEMGLKLLEQQRLQAAKLNTSADHTATKQNLEVIVEAIRHLEGEQLFVDTSGGTHVMGDPYGGQFRRMSFPSASRGFPMPLVSSVGGPHTETHQHTNPHTRLTQEEENAIIREQIMIAERERKACKV